MGGGAPASPSTTCVYGWNTLPLGQLLWSKELETRKEFTPLQAPDDYNLKGIIEEMKASQGISHASG